MDSVKLKNTSILSELFAFIELERRLVNHYQKDIAEHSRFSKGASPEDHYARACHVRLHNKLSRFCQSEGSKDTNLQPALRHRISAGKDKKQLELAQFSRLRRLMSAREIRGKWQKFLQIEVMPLYSELTASLDQSQLMESA